MWAGIAGSSIPNGGGFEVAISIHDSVYNTDFASTVIPTGKTSPEEIEKHVLESLKSFSNEHLCKFLGAGVTLSLLREVRSWRAHYEKLLIKLDFLYRRRTFVRVCGLRWILFQL